MQEFYICTSSWLCTRTVSIFSLFQVLVDFIQIYGDRLLEDEEFDITLEIVRAAEEENDE